MAEGKIRVKFEAEGNEGLVNAIKELNRQTRRLGIETKKTSTSTSDLNKKQERQKRNSDALNGSLLGMGGTLATMRSKMLLMAFATRQATQFLGGFIKESMAFQGVKRSFDQLSFSTDLSANSIEKLSFATNNTVSKMDIMKQANNAMLLGIADSTEKMSEMFEVSHKLAKAVGKDATFGIESLTTGIGRQSRLMLDNLGIIVIAEKAYKKYAETLEKKTTSLTDSEKKQAFLNEAMFQAKQMASLLPAPINDATDEYGQLTTSLDNAKIAFGQVLSEGAKPFINSLKAMSDLMVPERIEAYLFSLKAIASTMLLYTIYTKRAVLWQTRLGFGALATAAGILASELLLMSGIFEDSEESVEGASNAAAVYMRNLRNMKISELREELEKQNTVLKNSTSPLEQFKIKLDAANKVLKAAQTGTEGASVNISQLRTAANKLQLQYEALQKSSGLKEWTKQNAEASAKANTMIKILNDYISSLEGTNHSIKTLTEAQTKANSMFDKTHEGQRQAIVDLIDWVEAEKNSFAPTAEFTAVLEMLEDQLDSFDKKIKPFKETFKDIFKVDPEAINLSLSAFSDFSSALNSAVDANMKHELEALKKTDEYKEAGLNRQKDLEEKKVAEFKKQRERAWFIERAATISEAGMKIASATISALEVKPIPFVAAIVAGLGAAQMAALLSVPKPQFAQGGLITGNRHSRGGVDVNAEGGEFVMSRRAVSSIGVENLNRMNQGSTGGGGGINISINGGMISPEFVENELAESVREAVRRGADFGIG